MSNRFESISPSQLDCITGGKKLLQRARGAPVGMAHEVEEAVAIPIKRGAIGVAMRPKK